MSIIFADCMQYAGERDVINMAGSSVKLSHLEISIHYNYCTKALARFLLRRNLLLTCIFHFSEESFELVEKIFSTFSFMIYLDFIGLFKLNMIDDYIQHGVAV